VGGVEGREPAVTTTFCGDDGRVGSLVLVPSGSRSDKLAVSVVAARGLPVSECRARIGACSRHWRSS